MIGDPPNHVLQRRSTEDLLDLFGSLLRARAGTPSGNIRAVAQDLVLRTVERTLISRGFAGEIARLRQAIIQEPKTGSTRRLLESDDRLELTAHVAFVEPKPFHLYAEEWKTQIEKGATEIFEAVFGLEHEEVQLEIVLWEGGLWTRIRPKLETVLVILGLYVGMHEAAEYLQKDFEAASSLVTAVIENVSGGTVDEVKSFPRDARYWDLQLRQYRELLAVEVRRPKIEGDPSSTSEEPEEQ